MNTPWVNKFHSLLTKQRISYAVIAGSALWIAWLWSIYTGSNGFDRAGQVIGTDYIQFYAAGKTLLKGESYNLYNFTYQSELERNIIGPELTSFHAFITPPLFAVIFTPLAILPYMPSYAVWSIIGLLLLWISVRILSKYNRKKILIWSLLWFPVFSSISFGQNSLLSLVILSLIYILNKEQKLFLSGMTASLLFYKPQLLIGLIFLWLLEYKNERKTLLGFIVGMLVITLLNLYLYPEASSSYINFVFSELPLMISKDQFPIWHMHTIRGFWMLLFARKQLFADIIYICSIGVITPGFVNFIKRTRQNNQIMYAAAICFTILITPHAMIYDWSVLLIPAILLWNLDHMDKPLLKVIFMLMWIGAFISGPLTYLQFKYLGIALQVSIILFILSSYYLYKYFTNLNYNGQVNFETNNK